eukprot:1372016-Rhodomonas_salina.3
MLSQHIVSAVLPGGHVTCTVSPSMIYPVVFATSASHGTPTTSREVYLPQLYAPATDTHLAHPISKSAPDTTRPKGERLGC